MNSSLSIAEITSWRVESDRLMASGDRVNAYRAYVKCIERVGRAMLAPLGDQKSIVAAVEIAAYVASKSPFGSREQAAQRTKSCGCRARPKAG
jgi:hypothetical protein